MKRHLIFTLTLSTLMMLSMTVSAHNWHNEQDYDNDSNWQHTHHNDYDSERGVPFRWHDNYESMRARHHLERIHYSEWEHRFHGLQAYRWVGHEGFWHHGHYVKDAVLFFDRNHQLVSIGYMADGVFIQFRDDHESYENHDSFFLSLWLR